MGIDNEILEEFVIESKGLIERAVELLEGIEGDFAQVEVLAQYANEVDRIMGGAKSLALQVPKSHTLHLIGDYTALCKAVGYQASQIKGNAGLYDVCVALLLDATETLRVLIEKIYEPLVEVKKVISDTFLERLRWVSNQFDSSVQTTVKSAGMGQGEIDDLLKKLGL